MKVLLAVPLLCSILLAPCAFAQQAASAFSSTDSVAYGDGFVQLENVPKPVVVSQKQARDAETEAHYQAALKYDSDDELQQDLPQAAFRYRKAAMRGHARAMLRLGQMLQRGHGVPQDDAEAAAWYRAAADKGLVAAQYNLAWMLDNGAGVAQDYAQAAAWYEKAAQRGFFKAQFNLAVIYALGHGRAPEPEQAYKWFKIAAGDGDPQALQNLEALAPGLSAEQLARASRQAREWQPLASN